MRPSSIESGGRNFNSRQSPEALSSMPTAELVSLADSLRDVGANSSRGRSHARQRLGSINRQLRLREKGAATQPLNTSEGGLMIPQFETVQATFGEEKTDAPLNLLVVEGHFDDWIMAGALVVQLAENNVNVSTATLTGGDKNGQPRTRWKEARRVGRSAGFRSSEGIYLPDGKLTDHVEEAVDFLGGVVERIGPDIILAPSDNDPHDDHTAAHEVAVEVAGNEIPVHGMETIWNQDFNGNSLIPDWFVPVTEAQVLRARKLYLKYTSQTRVRTPDVQRVLDMSAIGGENIGVDYAVGYFEAKNVSDNNNALGDHVVYKTP